MRPRQTGTQTFSGTDAQKQQQAAKKEKMRRFYQENWLGVNFSSFSDLSFFSLADASFYEQFYEALSQRYTSWHDLPRDWRCAKELHASWLAGQAEKLAASGVRSGPSPLRVLSFGGGLGYVEYYFLQKLPDAHLHITEPGSTGINWLYGHIPQERIHCGAGIDALPVDMRFDFIYLSAAEYFFKQADLITLLSALRQRLEPGGKLVCISASLIEKSNFISNITHCCACLARAALHFSGIRQWQFWGWLRTPGEYREAMKKAGFKNMEDGRLADTTRSFWISGV